LFQKISEGMSAMINEALVVGDGIGRPLGLLHPQSQIPICETSESTPAGQFSWQDLVQLAMQIPVQWQANASFLMNQTTASFLLTMSDALGRPLLQSVEGLHDGPRWSLLGFPIYIASQMPNPAPGSAPVAFGDWRRGRGGWDVALQIERATRKFAGPQRAVQIFPSM
jgi:HK97 family phage major capsid protein